MDLGRGHGGGGHGGGGGGHGGRPHLGRRPPATARLQYGSYDWWWRTYGQYDGCAYSPPVCDYAVVDDTVALSGAPAVGFGETLSSAPSIAAPRGPSWGMAFASATVGAAAGWLIEEVATHIRGPRR